MLFHVLQSTTQVANAVGLTHNVWMQGNAQHKALRFCLMMQFVKPINEHLGKFLSAVFVADYCRNVIQLLHARGNVEVSRMHAVCCPSVSGVTL